MPRYQCSVAALDRTEPLAITASQVPAWLLIEVDGAWGADAIHDSALGDHVPAHFKDQMRRVGVRAVCVRQQQRRGTDEVRMFFVVPHRPPHVAPVFTRTVASLADVADAAQELSRHAAEPPGWERHDRPVVLVCTNGRHDQCCANEGRPVMRALRDSAWAPDVWESSHIGGDRFAANVVVLPRSLYFGRCQPDSVVALLDDVEAGHIDLTYYRGRSVYRLAEQAAEHFVRAEFGLTGTDDVAIEPGGTDVHVVHVVHPTGDGDGDRAELEVRVRRRMVRVPEALTCQGPPNQLTPVFHLTSITRR